ncbi:MAG: DMP19 family protein [Pirellulales bacterium]
MSTHPIKELAEIFQSKCAHELYHGIRDRIFELKCRHLEPFESYSQRLSEGERFVILVDAFICEVTNGGLEQFLGNSSGDYAEETRHVMRAIGAVTAADALDEVCTVIFGGSPIPRDQPTRCDILFAWDEERADSFFAKHDLGWCESVESAIAGYVLAHRKMFS